MTKLVHTCTIWGTPAEQRPTNSAAYEFFSPRAGGACKVTATAETILSSWDSKKKALLTTWIIDEHLAGNAMPTVTSNTLEDVKRRRPLNPLAKAERLLDTMGTHLAPELGAQVVLLTQDGYSTSPPDGGDPGVRRDWMLAQTESLHVNQVTVVLEYLSSKGWIERPAGSAGYRVTVEGFAHIDERKAVRAKSEQAFVAMWFDPSMDEAYTAAIKPGIEDAGYKARRIDASDHNNKIDDEIVLELRRSRFVVADFTHGTEVGHRGGVYYEAGFAHGLGIPVIFTCRHDCIAKVHFDTRQYNHIVWANPEELRVQLARRISATIGDGPLRPAAV